MKSKILLSFLFVALTGCISRKEIIASLFLNNGMSPEMCGKDKASSPNPVLWDYGFYRRLNAGGFEFISFCDSRSMEWVAVNKRDLENILNANLPTASPAPIQSVVSDQE